MTSIDSAAAFAAALGSFIALLDVVVLLQW